MGNHYSGDLSSCQRMFDNSGITREISAQKQAKLGFDEAVAEGRRAVGCGEAVSCVSFAQQLAAAGLKGLMDLLVAGDLDAGARVGKPQGGERHTGHRLVEIAAS